jgi:hypothetical protein
MVVIIGRGLSLALGTLWTFTCIFRGGAAGSSEGGLDSCGV